LVDNEFEQLADPHLHHWTMRAEALLDELKVPDAVSDARHLPFII
jgi:hypothetical protein